MSFVSAVIDTDPSSLLDAQIDSVNQNLEAAGYPGWEANDTTLAVIILAAVALIAADDANVAATVLPAIFRAFGTQLCNLPYQQGQQATIMTTWTFSSAAPSGGYTIPAATQVIIDGLAFQTQEDYTSATGDTSAQLLLVAAEPGTSYNNVGGINELVQANQQIDWVQSIYTQGVSANGVDQELDTDYENRLAALQTLQRIAVVNAADYPVALQSDLCAEQTGVEVGRATALDQLYPAPRALSTGGTAAPTSAACTLTNGSKTVTLQTPLTGQAPAVGAGVSGTGVPTGAVVAGTPAPTTTTFALSANATVSGTETLQIAALTGYGPVQLTCQATFSSGATAVTVLTPPYTGAIAFPGATVAGGGIVAGTTVAAFPIPTASGFSLSTGSSAAETGTTLTVSEWQAVPRCVTAFVTDVNGIALSAANMDALQAWLAAQREVGFLPFVSAPSYSTIYVSATVHPETGATPGGAVASAQAALTNFLSPANWGDLAQGQTENYTWLNSGSGYNIVRYLKLVGVVDNAPGVDYCSSLTLGFSASPGSTGDLTMPGPAPLPVTTDGSGNSTIVITAA